MGGLRQQGEGGELEECGSVAGPYEVPLCSGVPNLKETNMCGWKNTFLIVDRVMPSSSELFGMSSKRSVLELILCTYLNH